jgi:hypothetical protein
MAAIVLGQEKCGKILVSDLSSEIPQVTIR